MEKLEQYKRIMKWFSSSVIIVAEVLIYWVIWMNYYNPLLEKPFWRKGNWLVVALYAVMLVFFLHTYGGLKIGYHRKGNVIYSQILSIIIVNSITYIQVSLIDMQFHSVFLISLITLCEVIVIIIWATVFQCLYSKIFPPRKLLVVHGEYPIFRLMEKMNMRDDKYVIGGSIHISEGITTIMKEAEQYNGIIIGDITAHDRNLLLKHCYYKNVRSYTIPKLSDILVKTSMELNLFDSPLLLSRNEKNGIESVITKRLLDIVVAFILLIISSPIFLLASIAIKWTDGGSVFYKQQRYTQDKKIFWIYKFRTMREDAESDGVVRLAKEHDERITKIGKILRAVRLDELPQLFNILKGEMSVVGPRPERPEIADEYEKTIPEFVYRLKVKAGLTGYAQIYGKYNTKAYDKLKLDLTYIRTYSILLDLKLILMTPKIMLLKESTAGVDKN